jgi:hypothetical protein
MRTQVVKSVRMWCVYGVLAVGLVYSGLALEIQPTYASSDTCTPAECAAVDTIASNDCAARHAGVLGVSCSSNSDNWSFVCTDSYRQDGMCPAP